MVYKVPLPRVNRVQFPLDLVDPDKILLAYDLTLYYKKEHAKRRQENTSLYFMHNFWGILIETNKSQKVRAQCTWWDDVPASRSSMDFYNDFNAKSPSNEPTTLTLLHCVLAWPPSLDLGLVQCCECEWKSGHSFNRFICWQHLSLILGRLFTGNWSENGCFAFNVSVCVLVCVSEWRLSPTILQIKKKRNIKINTEICFMVFFSLCVGKS